MPRNVTASPFEFQSSPDRKKWTRKDCEFLVDSEHLVGRNELVDGEVIYKVGQKPQHAFVIKRLTALLTHWFGGDRVAIQLPIDVATADNETNQPEPDAAVLSQPATAYLESNPPPNDVLLLIEVEDTSLRFDLSTRPSLYSRAGIREYWVVDLGGRRLIAHRQPAENGYSEVLEYAEADSSDR
jgi:Uma2 family endonuclease